MPRPRINCTVHAVPDVTYYKPRGIPLRQLKEVALTVEGFEALRLADYEGMDQKQAAQQMQVSRATFGRIVSQARRTVAEALVHGMALRIQGGNYDLGRHPELRGQSSEFQNYTAPDTSQTNQRKEKRPMKIAVSSEGPTLDDLLDPRFGRAAGFIIFDMESDGHTYVDNGMAQSMAQGAGIKAAEAIINAGAEAVLTGYVGPKAFRALGAAGLRIAQNLENLTVRDAVERYRQGGLQWSEAPNSRGHQR
jgi:predicted DNA-binding protein (UPF0251 family)/predicted Fe-Mo cluster-binding NifX family protein